MSNEVAVAIVGLVGTIVLAVSGLLVALVARIGTNVSRANQTLGPPNGSDVQQQLARQSAEFTKQNEQLAKMQREHQKLAEKVDALSELPGKVEALTEAITRTGMD